MWFWLRLWLWSRGFAGDCGLFGAGIAGHRLFLAVYVNDDKGFNRVCTWCEALKLVTSSVYFFAAGVVDFVNCCLIGCATINNIAGSELLKASVALNIARVASRIAELNGPT